MRGTDPEATSRLATRRALARHFEHRNGRPGPGGGGRIDAAQVDPVRPQRQTPRLRQQPAQQGFGPRVIRLRRQRHPGRAPSRRPANRPAPGRGAATLPSPGRARFAHEARWPAMFPARCCRAGAVRRARSALASAGSISASQHSAASASRRNRPACGARAAPVRANNSRRARASPRCACALPRTAPPPGAGTRSSSGSRVPRPVAARGAGASRRLAARRIRRPGRRLDPVRRAPFRRRVTARAGRHLHIQRAVRIAQAGHFAGGEGQMLRGRAQQNANSDCPGPPCNCWRTWRKGSVTRARAGNACCTCTCARSSATPRSSRHACNCRPPIHTVAAMAAH